MKTATILSIPEVEQRLRQANIQPTAQRLAIYQYLGSQNQHLTAEQVKEWADDNFPKISLATVYNTLNLFAEAGLLKPIKLAHSERVIFDTNITPHYHFLDEVTGELIDIMPEALTMTLHLPEHYTCNSIDVVLKGQIGPS